MVSGRRRVLTPPRRRAIVAFIITALLVWWRAHSDGTFVMLGVAEPAASLLGPLLPAVSAGLTAAMTLSLIDTACGTLAGILGAITVIILPGFLPLHRESLLGPPAIAITVMMVGVMIHAPRFSIAYGALAATAAVFVSPAALGLVLSALGWAALVEGDANRRWRRVLFAVAPLFLVAALAHWLGSGWPAEVVVGWRGQLDVGLQAVGGVVRDQIAPAVTTPAIRWAAMFDLTLLLIGVVVFAWRRSHAAPQAPTATARLLPAIMVTGGGLAIGLLVRWLFLPESSVPGVESVLGLGVLIAISAVTAVATLWPRWPRWGKVVAGVIILGWVQAALRS